jgi:hypothetical protein
MSRNEIIKLGLWQPCINGLKISTKNQLRELVAIEYSPLLQKANFVQLLKEAERHLDLIEEFQKIDQLRHGDITRLARKFNFPVQRIHRYLKHGMRPRLYWLIEKCCSKTEARQRIARIYSELNGIRSFEDVMNKLDTYFPLKYQAMAKSFVRRINQVRKFFKALQLFKNGGCYKAVARSLKVSIQVVSSWISKGHKPDLLNLACQIPKAHISSNHKWLPMKLEVGNAFNPTNFISVPLHVDSWKTIQEVLEKIVPLKNHHSKQWENKFGKISKAEAFAYTLGLIVSDSRKETRYTSSRLDLSLSKVYDWSELVGEAFCYYLSKLGIKASKADDANLQNHRWQSRMAPLLTWMKQTGLGLQKNQTTSKVPIQAPWLLNAPHIIRLRILQGFTDGDGFTSVKGQCLGIASTVNKVFLQKLLNSFNINSFYSQTGRSVIIRRNESILQASSLPFFLHAVGRQEMANKLTEMIQIRKVQRRIPISKTVNKRMIQLKKEGMSNGAIIEQIFDEFRISLSRARVENWAKAL